MHPRHFIPLLLLTLAPLGCAAMKQAWVAQNCNREAAYAAGMNDARGGRQMHQNFASLCDPAVAGTINEGYREGYTATAGGGSVNVTVASAPPKQCIRAYGKEVCGWGCVEAYGQVRCADRPQDRCLEAYGKITCGTNCRNNYGQVICDETR